MYSRLKVKGTSKNMKVRMDSITVVLNEPRYPENIGAAARCCCNMGVPRLVVVRPYRLDQEKMLKMATHEAAHLIENMKVFDSLEDAVAKLNYLVGTTARTGRRRRPTDSPREIARRLAPLSQNNKIGLVFGSEKWGLTNKQLRLCHAIVTIPTAQFASINLAQSVMIICYELFMADAPDGLIQPKLANSRELEGMYEHLKQAFQAIGFINQENPDYWLENVRRLFSRLELRSKEVKLIRGFCRQVLWAVERKSVSSQSD